MAGIIGSEPFNDAGSVGVLWHTSLMTLSASPGLEFAPAEAFADAIKYAEAKGARVVSISLGWSFRRSDAALECVEAKDNDITVVADGGFDNGVKQARRAYRDLLSNAKAL